MRSHNSTTPPRLLCALGVFAATFFTRHSPSPLKCAILPNEPRFACHPVTQLPTPCRKTKHVPKNQADRLSRNVPKNPLFESHIAQAQNEPNRVTPQTAQPCYNPPEINPAR